MRIKKVAVLYSGGKSIGGIETYLLNLFKHIDKTRFDIVLLSMGRWELTKILEKDGHKVKCFDQKRFRPKTIGEVGKFCRANWIDLLVSQGVVANAYARGVARKFKIRNLVTVHSDQRKEYDNPFLSKVYLIIDKLGARFTQKYIAVSNFIKLRLVERGVKSEKITVIHNGIELPDAKTKAHKRLIIGSIGRLDYVKGFDILIEAFSRIENKRLRLLIAGDGAEKQNLVALANRFGVDNRVEFLGYKKDISELFDKVDIYVQPSRSEGFGLSLVQAMSYNLPVVATPVGAMPEIVADRQTGYLCSDMSAESMANAITEAVGNINESTEVGKAAGEYVRKNFSIENWIKKTEQAYIEAIK